MHILVTGSAGQLGCCLAERLIEQNISHTLVSRVELDIADKNAVKKCIAESGATIVINAAAYTAVDKAEEDFELAKQVNVIGPLNLAKSCSQFDIPLLHVSTDYVFDGLATTPYKESDPVGPMGVYGQTKLDGELAIAEAHSKHIILRTAWVYSEHANNFLKTMLRLAEARDELSVVDDQYGCPTYAGHIADALIVLAKSLSEGSQAYGVYHFAGDTTVTWCDFAKQIFVQAEAIGKIAKAPIVHAIPSEQFPTPAHRPAYSVLDSSKIVAQFGIAASDMGQGVNITLENLPLS